MMFDDFASLSKPFQLTVVGLSRDGGEWKSLGEMRSMLRAKQGRKWLSTCCLRVYAPENFLALWRRWFASKLGFSYIPGGEWTVPPDEDAEGGVKLAAISSPAALREWLKDHRMTQKALAAKIGWTPASVSHVLTGRRRKRLPQLLEAVQELAREFD